MFGGLKILARHDGLLVESFSPIISLLGQLDFGSSRPARIFSVSQRLQVISFGLIDIGGFEFGKPLSFLNSAALARVKPDDTSFIDRADDGRAIFGNEDLASRGDRAGN